MRAALLVTLCAPPRGTRPVAPERVNDFETAAERIECRGVVQVCGLLADFRVGCQGFPAHVVAAWLGHTVRVADAHYNQVTDEHFRRAIGPECKEESPPSQGAA